MNRPIESYPLKEYPYDREHEQNRDLFIENTCKIITIDLKNRSWRERI